jgi:hypothetical protein
VLTYTKSLLPLAILSLALFLAMFYYPHEHHHTLLTIIGLATMIWSSGWLKYWSRTNAELVVRWGTDQFEKDERPRPQVRGGGC